jgi:hypothetical protein
VEYLSRAIWLSETEVGLPTDNLKFFTDGSLFEGRSFKEFYRRNLISSHLSLLERSPLSFKLIHSVIKAGVSVPELSTKTFYS